MGSSINEIRDLTRQDYKWGFTTNIEDEQVPRGLSEEIVRLISAKKGEPEFMVQWRLKAFRHWTSLEKTQAEPKWANIHYGADRLPEHRLLFSPQAEARTQKPKRSRPGDSAHL